jgi:hypothetical protein
MAAHLQRVAALEVSPVAFLGVAGTADCYERASGRTDAARRERDARTARARRATRLSYLPQVSGLEFGVDFAAMAAADDQYAVDVRGDLALAGLL